MAEDHEEERSDEEDVGTAAVEAAAAEAVAEERAAARRADPEAEARNAEEAVPEADEFSLSREFYDAYKAYSTFIRKEEKKPEQSDLDELASKLRAIAFYVAKLRLFSPNEELEDVSTGSLKFLLLPFLLAEVWAATREMDDRLAALRRSLVYWRAFLHDCERLGLADAADLKAVERDPTARQDPASKREEKIDRFRRGKELDQKAEFLFSKKREVVGDEYEWGSGSGFDEDMERDLILALISRAAAAATENILMTAEEIPMLEMMAARGGAGAAPPAKPPAPKEKPMILRIQDKAELMRLYKEMVFQCPYTQATMSIEEAAEIEMAEARERQEEKDTHERRRAYEEYDRWYGGDRYGSKEDEEDEQKTYKDREWDDWKDAHPWGSGNKMANVS